MARQAEEHERREAPDVFLGADLAEASAGEAATDGKGESAILAGEEAWQPHAGADDGARVGARDETRQERAFEREVGRLVVQQQARRDAGGERDDETGGEHQPIGPVALLEDEDVAETPVTDEHRGQRRHHRQLDDERREEELLGG